MKIVMITASDLSVPHGPVIHFMELAKALAKSGPNVTVLAPALGRFDSDTGFDIKYLGVFFRARFMARFIFQLRLMAWLARHIRSFDIVYTRLSFLMFAPPWIAKCFRVKHMTEINGNLFRDRELRELPRIMNIYLWLLQKNAYSNSFKIFALTQGLKDHIMSVFKCPPEKISVLGVGVDTEKFYDAPVAEARKKLNLDPEGVKYIGYTGTLDVWQGVELMLEAVKKLSGIYKPFKVIIVGFGRQEQAYRQRVDQLKISEHVRFVGRVPHGKIADYIRVCHLLVIPRTEVEEGYAPIKLLEYLACGRPVVAAKIKGFEILETHQCGLTYEAGSAERLCQALKKGLEDHSLWDTMRTNARQVALDQFGWERIAAKTMEEME